MNPQPGYESSRYNWQPRIQLDWHATSTTSLHAGGAIMSIPPNIWQDNMLTGGTPFVIYPRITATAAAPIAYGFQIEPSQLPRVYTNTGQDMFPGDKTTSVAANREAPLFPVVRAARLCLRLRDRDDPEAHVVHLPRGWVAVAVGRPARLVVAVIAQFPL